MTDPNDHTDDVRDLDDSVVEDLLQARAASGAGELGKLARLVEDIRQCFDSPAPPPSRRLRSVLEHGMPVARDHLDRPAPERPGSRPRPARRRAQLASRAALGVTLVAASITAAAASGVLPRNAERAVTRVIERFTPFQFRGPSEQDRGHSEDGSTSGPSYVPNEAALQPPPHWTAERALPTQGAGTPAVREQFDGQDQNGQTGRFAGALPLPSGQLEAGNPGEQVTAPAPTPDDPPDGPRPTPEAPGSAPVDPEDHVPRHPDGPPGGPPDPNSKAPERPDSGAVEDVTVDARLVAEVVPVDLPTPDQPDGNAPAVPAPPPVP